MKNFFLPLLIIGLLLSASFSLIMMNHMDEPGHNNCPFKAPGVADCVQVQSPLDFISSHLNSVSRFFSAIPVNSFTVSLTLILVLTFAVFIIFNKKFELFKFRPLLIENRLREFFVPPNKILFSHWFAFHENSPAFIGGR